MKIWEIKNAFVKLQKMLDNAAEEENEVDKAYLQDLITKEWEKGEEALSDKLEAMAGMMKNFKHMEEAYKKEKDLFAKKEKTMENQQEFIKNRMILPTLKAAKLEKLECGVHKVSIRHSKACEVQDMAAVPEQFIKEEIRKSADKREILKLLKEGERIAGCVLLENESVQIK